MVAHFESKMLLRSWAFRFIAFLCFAASMAQASVHLALIYFVSAEAYLGPVFTSSNVAMMVITSIGGVLTLTVVFLANDIGSRDKRIGVVDVIGSRPLTDAQYVFGRLLGLLIPLTVMMLLVAVVAMSIIRAVGLLTVSYDELIPFFISFNVISVTFTVALTTLASSLLKNRLFTSLVVIAYFILSGWLFTTVSDMFDTSGYRTGGVYSSLIGYGPIADLALHRLAYVMLTLFLIMATVYFYPRPEASRRSRFTTAGFTTTAIASVTLLAFLGFTRFQADAQKSRWADALTKASTNQAAGVNHYDMDIELLPEKAAIQGTVTATLVNRGDVGQDTFVFVLNPGLKIDALTVTDDAGASFSRTGPLIELTLSAPLRPGDTVESMWKYGGKIDPDAAWLSGPSTYGNWWEPAQQLQLDRMMGELSGWVGRRYCFLLPESNWYPTPNSTFGHTYPDKRPSNFATAQISLHMPETWTGVTQGQLTEETKSAGESVVTYAVDTPVPQFSLTAGEYAKITAEVDGVQLALLYAPEHNKNVDFMADAGEEIKRVISESFERIEDAIGLEYPYPSLSIVEVPASCRSFSDSWDGRNLFVQPGVLMLHENIFFNAHFVQSYEWAQERTKNQGTGATDAQIKTELLRRYFTGNSFGGDVELNILPNYWEFQVDATGNGYPALGSAFTASLAERALGRHQRHAAYALAQLTTPSQDINFAGQDNVSDEERQARTFSFMPDTTLNRELLKMPLASMTPTDQEEKFVPLLNGKTRGLLDSLAMAMDRDDWETFVPTLLNKYRYKSITIADLQAEAASHTSDDLSWIVNQFANEAVMPGYVIEHVEVYEIDHGQREQQFQSIVRVANLEEGKGFAMLYFEMESKEEAEVVTQKVMLEGNEVKEIRTVLSMKPQSVRLHSPYARNLHDPIETILVPEEVRTEAGENSEITVDSLDTVVAVVVDDLDAGFTTEKDGQLSLAKNGDALDYPVHAGFRSPKQWREQTSSGSYGRYQRTRKIKRAGEGTESAVWSASLPEAGTYEVFFYVADKSIGRYQITIENGEATREIELDLKSAESEWNSLGKFPFEENENARVLLSDELLGGSSRARMYADAVKWVLVESIETAG
jgi:ABC-type transport system involved in multi-copper enzyme maturation permease subunit